MHEYGVTREQLGWIPVTQRAHAALNPDAVYREPLSIEDYLGFADDLVARSASTTATSRSMAPTAIVVSAVETAPDLRAPVRIEAMAGVIDGRPSWEQWEDMGRVGYATAAAMWSRTDLTARDVDVAQLYDGFTIEAVWWLEAMGFCGTGEAGAFVEGGDAHRARRPAAPQHLGRPAVGRAAPRGVRPHRRGGAPTTRRGRRRDRWRGRRWLRSPTSVGSRPARRC